MIIGVRGKLFAISLMLITSVILASGAFLESKLRDLLNANLESRLVDVTKTARVALTLSTAREIPELDALADQLGENLEVRFTIIALDGTVLGDSRLSVDQVRAIENHAGREEVVAARANGLGVSRRFSTTMRTDMLYVAIPYPNRAVMRGVIRAAIPLAEVEETTSRLRIMLLLAAGLGLTIAVLMSAIASELMSRALRSLVTGARAVARGEQDGRLELTSQDELGRLAGSFNRITEELNQTVADLGEERDRLQTILERMHDGVIALDADDQITLANSAAGRMLRIRDSDIGRQLIEVARAPELIEIVERSQQGIASAAEFRVLGARERIIFAHAAPLRQVGGTVVVLHDVTEVRRLETVRRDFVANVSHELRTPVSVVRANAETLLNGALSDQERAPAFVEAIHRNAERLSSLIADLLDLSRIEAGALKIELGPIMVYDAVTSAVDALRSKAEKRGIQLHVHAADNIAVRADRIALSQVLHNLLDNALKFSQEKGDVKVRALTDDDEEETVRIEVEDDGPGIAPTHRKRVFERFYRVDAGRSRELGGTGLGLAIVKHLAESMGGRVGVSPAPDHGSVFWVELPREVPTVRPAASAENQDADAAEKR